MSFASHILVTTDFSNASELAVEAAPLLAKQNRARVTLVHVLPVDPLAVGQIEQSLEAEKALEVAVHQRLDKIRMTTLKEVEDVKTALLRGNNAAAEICTFAEEHEVDLIVVATHGRTGLTRFLVGSVAERISRHSPCPVLMMRSKRKD